MMSNFRLNRETCNGLKIVAIFMVIISHWYRYVECDSALGALKSLGVFGASLFAFLSGYGINSSYLAKGIRGLLQRVSRVYIPFLIVNFLSALWIYNDSGFSFFTQLFTGFHDGVMWYIPFVIGFYTVFWFSDKLFR